MPANDPMSAVRSKIEADNVRARARFAEVVPCFTSGELAELEGHGAENRSATGSRWKAEKKAFSVQLGGRELFPAFQFRDGKPDWAVAQVLDALPSGMNEWQVAFWFVSSNPWLDGGGSLGKSQQSGLACRSGTQAGRGSGGLTSVP